MKKYWLVIKNTWDEILTYRLSFIIWRVRTVFQLLVVYFLWTSVIPKDATLFGYSMTLMVTYILLTQVVGAFVLATRTAEIAENINSGDLSIFLIKPFGYFRYWFARDIGDKAMNISFSIVELTILFLLLQPQIFIQNNFYLICLFIVAVIIGIILNFFISSLLSMIGFWSPDVWGPRFIFYILITFFTGGFFPLDILPKTIYNLMMLTPFPYLQFFPIKIYLGQLSSLEIISGIIISLVWILSLVLILKVVWNKGIKSFTAAGR